MDDSAVTRQGLGTGEGIPETRQVREQIALAVSEHCKTCKLMPPLSTAELKEHANVILERLGLDEVFFRYTAVVLNNELWRDRFASIPYHQRLLLLPVCLRNKDVCTATIDQYGLECNRCGHCIIDKCLDEAEALGYVCLVAEGVVIVMSLIESGQVRAVLGVSCLESLEKVFPYMQMGGIPGIALPLLSDGCTGTHLDSDLLWDTLHLASTDDTSDLDLLKQHVEGWFTREALIETLGEDESHAGKIALDWMMMGGKYWRPFLAACAHDAIVGGSAPPEYMRTIAVALECFHKASLVHDDIEDDDPARYGHQTLHVQYGVPVAINAGDLLIGHGYRLLASADVPDDIRISLIDVAADAHRKLCIGQGEELGNRRESSQASVEDLIEISKYKTSPAFEAALKLGVLAAGCGEKYHKIISEFSDAIGIAYQIRDDLMDAGGNEYSIVSALARVNGDDGQSAARQLMKKYRLLATDSIAALDQAELKLLLNRIVSLLLARADAMECCDEHNPSDDNNR